MVLSGRCAELGDSVPYLPLADALRNAITGQATPALVDAIVSRPVLGLLLPAGDSAEMPGGATPSDVEIETWYKDNQARVGGRSLDQLRTQIEQMKRDKKPMHERLEIPGQPEAEALVGLITRHAQLGVYPHLQ